MDRIWIECASCGGELAFESSLHPDGPADRNDHWNEANGVAKAGATKGICGSCGITASTDTQMTTIIVYDTSYGPKLTVMK